MFEKLNKKIIVGEIKNAIDKANVVFGYLGEFNYMLNNLKNELTIILINNKNESNNIVLIDLNKEKHITTKNILSAIKTYIKEYIIDVRTLYSIDDIIYEYGNDKIGEDECCSHFDLHTDSEYEEKESDITDDMFIIKTVDNPTLYDEYKFEIVKELFETKTLLQLENIKNNRVNLRSNGRFFY